MAKSLDQDQSPAQTFASNLVAQLASYGCDFWVAPGARSQALAIAAASVARVSSSNLSVRIDERSLAFSALGASISGRLQVVITTSGTAVANLHPAVLEAHHSGVPLILLTADRPAELRGVGANQTTNQVGIFSDAVSVCEDIDPMHYPGLPGIAAQFARRLVTLALTKSQPIQLNIQFREPLSANTPDAGEIFLNLQAQPTLEITKTKSSIKLHENAVVIAGANSASQQEEIRSLGLPIFAEPSSGVRHLDNSILNYRKLLKTEHPLVSEITQLIVYGKPTLSREVIKLLKSENLSVVSVIGQMGEYKIPETVELVSGIERANFPSATWLSSWQELEQVTSSSELDRQAIVERSWNLNPDDVLVLGASQLIREADFYAPKKGVTVWSNRGLSGIDGTIATATGIAMAKPKAQTRVLMGDLTFLHDVGSLVIEEGTEDLNIQLIVVNDNGGKIFSNLEVKSTVSEDVFNRVFKTGQNFDIAKLAQGFGWQYVQVGSLGELDDALLIRGRVIIEIKLG